MTALALIFAAFLTNPSPICVLDEVDAPLDDQTSSGSAGSCTRCVATRDALHHHHAKSDHDGADGPAVGVTMAERGVSQPVPVGLEDAVNSRPERG